METKCIVKKIEGIEIAGTHYRFMYESHGITKHNPESLNDLNCLFFELVDHKLYDNPNGSSLNELVFRLPVDFIDKIQKMQIPVEFIDIRKLPFFGELSNYALSAVTITALSSILLIGVTDSAVNRRSFVRGGLASLLALKVIPPIRILTDPITECDDPTENGLNRVITKLDETVNFETTYVILAFRNLIWAYKMKVLIEKMQIKINKPKVGIVLGAHHSTLEDYLALDKSILLNKIRRASDILKKLGADLTGISDAGSMGPSTNYVYKPIEFPEIKELES